VQLFVHDAHGNPIDDLGSPPTLQLEVIFGSQTSSPLGLEASFDPDTGLGTRGEFDAAIMPTAAGDYTFHFFGSINGQKVDERFTSGPTTFNTVQDPTPIQFPARAPTVPELATLADRLSSRVDHAATAASNASNKAGSADTVGLVGLIVGAVGLILGATALAMTRRRTGPAPAPTADLGRPGA
jgi:hypothetical protein